MKVCHTILHLLLTASLLLSMAACTQDDTLPQAATDRTLHVSLGISTRAVTDDTQNVRGQVDRMQVWMFGSNTDPDATALYYSDTPNPPFSGTDIMGRPVQTVDQDITVTGDTQTLYVVVVLNSGNATGLTLDDSSTWADLQGASFTALSISNPLASATNPDADDNRVPMQGSGSLEISAAKRDYRLTIDVERCAAKLDLRFTKESENAYLAITGLYLAHVPTHAYLFPKAATAPDNTIAYTATLGPLLTEETVVSTFLTDDTPLGNFSQHEESFTRLPLNASYLLENPNGGNWSEVDGNHDYTYTDPYDPDKQTDADYTDGSTRYKLTINYQTTPGGEEKEQVVYLPKMERNTWNKVYARVKGGMLTLQYKALPWDVVSTSIGYAPQHIPTDRNPFANNVAWANSTVAKGNYYALFPITNYSSSWNTTTKLMDYMYDNPHRGDNEARLCILTRPTYDDKIDDNEHWALKSGSAGARYMFILTGPEGATWEAHLSNEEDFSFSTTEEDDFNHSEYESEGKVYKVTHGIARQKPYIIQVIADHLYTGYKEGLSGETTEGSGYDGNGYNQYSGNSADKWKPLFEDNYLTDWGNQKWNNREVVETELYITVRLADGTEYELTINPSYTDSNLASCRFPFKEKRRFAGTDTRIWIRHVRAQHNWPNLEYMAWDCKDAQDYNDDNRIEDYEQPHWWTVNPYWNPDHEWKD